MKAWSREALHQLQSQSSNAHLRCAWDCSCYYKLDESKLNCVRLRDLVVQMSPDETARRFILESHNVNPLRVIIAILLRTWYSTTDSNAIANTGYMHVLSTQQAAQLLNIDESSTALNKSLLDVGAGDGFVTAQLAPLFSSVSATDTCRRMTFRLKERGFKSYETADPCSVADAPFDVVSCLNVLDRCAQPKSLLTQIHSLLKPLTGLLLLAVVLPFRPGVEDGTGWKQPFESLPLAVMKDQFEMAITALVVDVIEPIGYEIVSLSSVPYLSYSVSLTQDYTTLRNAVIVCRVLNDKNQYIKSTVL